MWRMGKIYGGLTVKRKRYLYVWEGVWADWTSGIAFAVSDSLENALKAHAKKWGSETWKLRELGQPTQIVDINEDYANGVCGGG